MTRRAVDGPTPSSSCNRRNHASSSDGLSASRNAHMRSLTCAASTNLSPPYFTNGIDRSASAELEERAVVVGADQHRLVAEAGAVLARFEDSVAHRFGLCVVVVAIDQFGPRPHRSVRHEPGPEAHGGVLRDRIGRIADRLRRSIVAVQDDRVGTAERSVELEKVPCACRTEPVDRLRIVAHNREAWILAAQRGAVRRPGDRLRLGTRRPEHGRTRAASRGPSTSSSKRGAVPQQQIVEVEQSERALALHVVAAHGGDLVLDVDGPWRGGGDHLRQPLLRVHGTRVQVQQGCLAREPPVLALRPAVVLPNEVEDVGGIRRRRSPRSLPGSARWAACRRRVWCAIEWNVPPTRWLGPCSPARTRARFII